ncbi:MAG: His/Gly/Thr/Pro-type tRNA ligase C-terminal domain-containing protein [bacterium]|nr:His/Gly/Thr/Pro-type tRNA ligase C-terminal domain-containing protein [bacterium]
MRVSKLFTKTRKDAPAEEVAHNAQLLIKAGYVHKMMAGVYAYTPLGLRVIEKIKQIVREEMDKVDGQEMIMTNLQPSDIWKQTGRWDDEVVDIWFKTKLFDETEVGLAWSHEEPFIDLMKQHISSYKDLPIHTYQFQTKLRNEKRAKSGIMRGREFVMKDSYTFTANAEEHEKIYNAIMESYKTIFKRVGIGKDTYVTFASGGAFTKFSHEFQTVTPAGEDTIYLHKGKNIAINEEVLDADNLKTLGINRDELEEVKSSEVGNIFNFGTDKSQDMDFTFTDENGKRQFVYLGSYGIGITRLMGVIVEKHSDEKGLVWADNIAPYKVYLASVGEDEAVAKHADMLYDELTQKGIEVLYDDRDVHPGEKFADSDLLGIPHRVVVSKKTIDQDKFEYKSRTSADAKLVSKTELLELLG